MRDAALLVASCDAYSDLWPFTIAQLRAMWPDCPMPQYLLVNERVPGAGAPTPIVTGADRGWSANLRVALERMPEEYVFLYIDDLFLTRRVDNAAVEGCLRWAQRSRASYLRLEARPWVPAEMGEIAVVPRGSPYRTATVMSFWRKQVLHDLLDPRESAWEFERAGALRSDAYDGFYATARSHFSFANLVVKGKLRRRAPRLLGAHGHDPAGLRRAAFSAWGDARYAARDLCVRGFWALPRPLQAPVRQLVRAGRTAAAARKQGGTP